MSDKKQAEVSVATIAIAAIRFLTPTLIAILVWISTQALDTLDELVSQVNDIKIVMAAKDARDAEVTRTLSDHEVRIRQLERLK
jgi:hypothetical protein